MSYYTRISKAFQGACRLPLHQNSKYIIFSDCHRGTGRANDNFLKNEYIYLAALNYYFRKGYTYLELGDGDELWENRSFHAIKDMHSQTFEMLSRYFHCGRFYALYGNHDIVKRYPAFSKKYFQSYYCDHSLCHQPLFPDICFHSGIILENREGGKDIYLTHGHQASLFNSTLWPLARFLVRYIWRPLEIWGLHDPTSGIKNNVIKNYTEKRLASWAKRNKHPLITGHTHHPMMGTVESPYFNSGSCISPAGITCIEIENRCITLVKWTMETKTSLSLYVARNPLGNQVCIDDY